MNALNAPRLAIARRAVEGSAGASGGGDRVRGVAAAEGNSAAGSSASSQGAASEALAITGELSLLANLVVDDAKQLLMFAAAAKEERVLSSVRDIVARHVAEMMRMVMEACSDEMTSRRQRQLLGDVFLPPCRVLKDRTMAFLEETRGGVGPDPATGPVAAVAAATATGLSYVAAAEQVARIEEAAGDVEHAQTRYLASLKARSETIKSAVVTEAKELIVALKALKDEVLADGAGSVSVPVREVSERLDAFFRIARAALLEEQAMLLRSSVTEVVKVATRREAGDEGVVNDRLADALTNAVNAVRQIVYAIMSREDWSQTMAERDAEVPFYSDMLPTETEEQMATTPVVLDSAEGGKRYRLEPRSAARPDWAAVLERAGTAISFYESHFRHRDHINLFGITKEKPGLVIASILREADGGQRMAIVRTSERDTVQYLPAKAGGSAPSDKELTKTLRAALPPLSTDSTVSSDSLTRELADFEAKNLFQSFKFGVLELPTDAAECTEEVLYGARSVSPALREFLDVMGEQVTLSGHTGYRGGLDVKRGTTGDSSYFTKFQSLEVMFHVAPLLPYTEGDVQQVERKRHVGNDIVVIVFRESVDAPPFRVSCIASHFNAIFAVVTPVRPPKGVDAPTHYRIEVAVDESCPSFGPFLVDPPVYRADKRFREALLAKLINGERAVLASPTFQQKMARTRRQFMTMMVNEFAPDVAKKMPK